MKIPTSSNHSTTLGRRRRLVTQVCSILSFLITLRHSKCCFECWGVPGPGQTCLEMIFILCFGFGAQNLPSITWDLAMTGHGAWHLQDLSFATDLLHRVMRAALILLLLISSAYTCWVPFCKLCSGHHWLWGLPSMGKGGRRGQYPLVKGKVWDPDISAPQPGVTVAA